MADAMTKIREREISSGLYDALVQRLEPIGAFETEVKKRRRCTW